MRIRLYAGMMPSLKVPRQPQTLDGCINKAIINFSRVLLPFSPGTHFETGKLADYAELFPRRQIQSDETVLVIRKLSHPNKALLCSLPKVKNVQLAPKNPYGVAYLFDFCPQANGPQVHGLVIASSSKWLVAI